MLGRYLTVFFTLGIKMRDYVKKLGSRQYISLNKASLKLSCIAEGEMSDFAASKIYKISYGTLYNKLHGLHTNVPGTPTVFSVKEEKMFITAFFKYGKWGYPLDLNDLRFFAKSYLDKVGKKVESLKITYLELIGLIFLLKDTDKKLDNFGIKHIVSPLTNE